MTHVSESGHWAVCTLSKRAVHEAGKLGREGRAYSEGSVVVHGQLSFSEPTWRKRPTKTASAESLSRSKTRSLLGSGPWQSAVWSRRP